MSQTAWGWLLLGCWLRPETDQWVGTFPHLCSARLSLLQLLPAWDPG